MGITPRTYQVFLVPSQASTKRAWLITSTVPSWSVRLFGLLSLRVCFLRCWEQVGHLTTFTAMIWELLEG